MSFRFWAATLWLVSLTGCYVSHQRDADPSPRTLCCFPDGDFVEVDGECPSGSSESEDGRSCSCGICCAPEGDERPALCRDDLLPCDGPREQWVPDGALCPPSVLCCTGRTETPEAFAGECPSDAQAPNEAGYCCDWCCDPSDGVCDRLLPLCPVDGPCGTGESVWCCAPDGVLREYPGSECPAGAGQPLGPGESCVTRVEDRNFVVCGERPTLPDDVYLLGDGCCPATSCEVELVGDEVRVGASIDFAADDCDCDASIYVHPAGCDFRALDLPITPDPIRVVVNGYPISMELGGVVGLHETYCKAPPAAPGRGCGDGAFTPREDTPDDICYRPIGGRYEVEGFFACTSGCEVHGACEAITSLAEGSLGTEVRFLRHEAGCGGACLDICEPEAVRCLLARDATLAELGNINSGERSVPPCDIDF